MTRLRALLRGLRGDASGLALIEFALTLPVVVLMSLGGAELTNYVTVKMRMSQIALQIADNAARMGSGTATQAKQVTETDINDLFAGAQMESGGLDLNTNGRVILSDLETVSGSSPTQYKIKWQRCYGSKTTYPSTYGTTATAASTNGIGPAGRQATAQDSTPTMFVEVYFVYKPVVSNYFAQQIGLTSSSSAPTLTEIASMSVRDRRDTTQIYNTAGATVASC